MFKRINWRSVFKGFAWIICLGGLVVLMSFISAKRHSVTCTDIKILIPGADNFIEREEVDAILKQSQGILIGKELEGINLHEIEDRIKANPYIAFAKVYSDMDGVISIHIKQRQPILRVINSAGQDYYVDKTGLKMPVSPNFTANVLVANGTILEHFSGKVDTLITRLAGDLYKTALYISADSLWDAQIEQIYVNDKKDIELIPRLGEQRIILGNADSINVKMKNLSAFYKKAMPKVGWYTYKTINVKYANQIVCEKNDTSYVSKKESMPVSSLDSAASKKKATDSVIKEEILEEIENTQQNNITAQAILPQNGKKSTAGKDKTDTEKNN
jgi:cell division protein FtsQ